MARISNVKFDKVVVWDGGAGGGNGAANFVKGLGGMLPPMMNMMKDIGGVEMPAYFGKLGGTESSEADPASSKARATPASASPPVKDTKPKNGSGS